MNIQRCPSSIRVMFVTSLPCVKWRTLQIVQLINVYPIQKKSLEVAVDLLSSSVDSDRFVTGEMILITLL